jgi:hypothetical protein
MEGQETNIPPPAQFSFWIVVTQKISEKQLEVGDGRKITVIGEAQVRVDIGEKGQTILNDFVKQTWPADYGEIRDQAVKDQIGSQQPAGTEREVTVGSDSQTTFELNTGGAGVAATQGRSGSVMDQTNTQSTVSPETVTNRARSTTDARAIAIEKLQTISVTVPANTNANPSNKPVKRKITADEAASLVDKATELNQARARKLVNEATAKPKNSQAGGNQQ